MRVGDNIPRIRGNDGVGTKRQNGKGFLPGEDHLGVGDSQGSGGHGCWCSQGRCGGLQRVAHTGRSSGRPDLRPRWPSSTATPPGAARPGQRFVLLPPGTSGIPESHKSDREWRSVLSRSRGARRRRAPPTAGPELAVKGLIANPGLPVKGESRGFGCVWRGGRGSVPGKGDGCGGLPA